MEHFNFSEIDLWIFDFNGTLLNDLFVNYGSIITFFEQYGVKPPTLQQFREEPTVDFLSFLHRHGIPSHVTIKDYEEVRRAYYKKNRMAALFRRDAFFVLKELAQRGKKMAIVSGELSDNIENYLRLYDLARYFPEVRAAVRGDKAPTLQAVADHFGVPVSRSIYVEDAVDGIISARKIGMPAIGLCHDTAYCSTERIAENTPLLIRNLVDIFDFI